jgi:hypothetical protein
MPAKPAAEHDRDAPPGRPGWANRRDRRCQRLESRGVGGGEGHEPGLVPGDERAEIRGRHVRPELGHRPTALAKEMVETGETDHVVFTGDPGKDRERPDPTRRSELRPDALERAEDGLRRKMLFGDAPLAGRPPLPDEAHRIEDESVVHRRPWSLGEGMAQDPCRELFVAVREQAREEFGGEGRGGHRGRSGRIDGREARGLRIAHGADSTIDYHADMYLDALEFLEEERDAWRPYEALANLTDEQLTTPVDAAHGWSGRDLIVHMIGWLEISLQIARELAVGERSPAMAAKDAAWDERGGEAVNAEILERASSLSLDELRDRLLTVPGELRGYLTVVPETRWLKHPTHMKSFTGETIEHYADHQADLESILAAARR